MGARAVLKVPSVRARASLGPPAPHFYNPLARHRTVRQGTLLLKEGGGTPLVIYPHTTPAGERHLTEPGNLVWARA